MLRPGRMLVHQFQGRLTGSSLWSILSISNDSTEGPNTMMMPSFSSSSLRRSLLSLVTLGLFTLCGCANSFVTPPSATGSIAPATIAGVVHGGQYPVYNATVKLYTAGTTGYGAGSILQATTTSDVNGNFQFTLETGLGGVVDGGASALWKCPSTGNPLVYITAIGGNSSGSGSTTPNNAAIGLMSAIGLCGNLATTTEVAVNELTTVASVYALANYINPGATAGTETIGTNSTTQATTGLNNAFSTIANLANTTGPGAGGYVTSNTYPGVGTAIGATMTATPESAKLITIANILASCINTTSSSSNNCADLFASASPPASATTTSQPGATFATAADTIQAAYYLAVNPANNGAFTTCNNGGTTKTGCLWGLASSTSPFQTGLTTAPSDWTIGVTFTGSLGTGTCANGDFLIAAPYHAAVDANGNIWYINGGSTISSLVELSPVGQPIVCTGSLSNGRGLTIDTTGNVWGSFNGTATNGIVEWPAGGSALTVWPVPTGNQTYEMTSDGFGNVFFNQNASGGSIWEFIDPGTTTTPFAPVEVAGPLLGTGTITQGYIQVDPQGRIWDATSTDPDLFEIYPKTSSAASITGFSVSGGTVTFNATNSYAVGNQIEITSLTSTEGATFDTQVLTLTAVTSSTFSAATSAATTSGTVTDSGTGILAASYTFAALTTVNTSYGIAIDSNNYLYQGTTCCAGAGDREAVKWTPGGTLGTATYTASSQNFAGINGVRSTVVDGASNVFYGNEYPNSSGATISAGTYSVSELTTSGSGTTATFTALSPAGSVPGTCSTSAGCGTTGGFFDSDFQEPLDMQIDPSGNLWVLNTFNYAVTTSNGLTITELVGAAVPVVTPLSVAVKNNQLGAKP